MKTKQPASARGYGVASKAKNRRERGFTLLEIMIVISIIVVLLGLAINKMGNPLGFAKGVGVKADIQAIGTQLKLYESMNGFYPSTDQGLEALVNRPNSEPQPSRWYQLFKDAPKDPWQNPYIYRCPGIKNIDSYDLFSAGPDRKADTPDDDWGQ